MDRKSPGEHRWDHYSGLAAGVNDETRKLRGFTVALIRNFRDGIGAARSDRVVYAAMLEPVIRDDLDKKAPPAICLLNPLKVTLSNFEAGYIGPLSMGYAKV